MNFYRGKSFAAKPIILIQRIGYLLYHVDLSQNCIRWRFINYRVPILRIKNDNKSYPKEIYLKNL